MPTRPEHQAPARAGLLPAAIALVLAGAALQAEPVTLQTQQPIESADRLLRSQGWQPNGDPQLDSFDRELSGNGLASLRSCSGTGVGFCRYDYRRGSEQLEVITVPSSDGDGLVHHWQQDGSSSAAPNGSP